MNLSEQEIRQIIRKRIIAERLDPDAGDVVATAGGTVAGVGAIGTGMALAAHGGTSGIIANAAATGFYMTAAGAPAGAVTVAGGGLSATSAVAAGFGTTGSGTALASGLAGTATTVEAVGAVLGVSNPIGWAIGATVAVGFVLGYCFMSKASVGDQFKEILDGTLAIKTQGMLKQVEAETRQKLIDAGLTEQARGFPSLEHLSLIHI